MIDIFRLGEFQRFYMEQYPELKIKTCYSPIGFYLNFTIQSQKGTSNGCFPCYETDEAISKLNMVIIDFLAKVGV